MICPARITPEKVASFDLVYERTTDRTTSAAGRWATFHTPGQPS